MGIAAVENALAEWQGGPEPSQSLEQRAHPDRLRHCLQRISPKDLDELAEAMASGSSPDVVLATRLLPGVFELGTLAIQAGISHNTVDYLVRLYHTLAVCGVHVAPSEDYLKEVLGHYAVSRTESQRANDALDALIQAVAKNVDGNPEVLLSAMLLLDIYSRALNPNQAPQLREILNSLEPQIQSNNPEARILDKLKTAIVWSLDLQDLVDAALSTPATPWNSPAQVISVHSTKGGVGKTFFATSLAVALAKDGRKVCVVDADDQGPAVHFAFRVDKKAQATTRFFSEWFVRDRVTPGEGLAQRFVGHDDKITGVVGSLNPVELDALDKAQRGPIPPRGNYRRNQERMEYLVRQLLESFDHVIIDCGPGFRNLSLDVMLMNARNGGDFVFVMRARVADVYGFAIEAEWIRKRIADPRRIAICLNFSPGGEKGQSIKCEFEPNRLAKRIVTYPQFLAYSLGLPEGRVRGGVVAVLQDMKAAIGTIAEVPFLPAYARAGWDRYESEQAVLAEIVADDPLLQGETRAVLKGLGLDIG
jgi:Mrp family chromosome partitioning ATPase